MESIARTLSRMFDPVLNFFQQVWDFIVFVFSFLRDLIEGLYYGFNTIISNLWSSLHDILGLGFFSSNSGTFNYISSLLGFNGSGLFFSILMIAIFLVGLRFVWSLLPFFKK